jgi:signal transduction histidine kinase/ActR/RegA family two-component response regulator
MRSGTAQDVVEAPMMVERNGYTEEAFFTGNFTPIRGVDGKIEGFYNALFEVTRQKILDRWKVMLNLLATPSNMSVEGVYSHIMASLASDPLDIPMAVLYEADTAVEPGKSALRVRGHLGIPEGHDLLRDGQDLAGAAGFAALYREAIGGRVLTVPDERFEGVDWLGFKEAPKIVVTVALGTLHRHFGFLMVGTNPYRPFDDTCEEFIKDLTRTASSVLASAWDAENLRKNQERLQNDLNFSNMKVRHLVEHASVGMAHAKSDGRLVWANDKFLSLASPSTETNDIISNIYDIFLDDDRPEAQDVWERIFSSDNHVAAELRLAQHFNPPVGEPRPAQVQILAFPFKEHGLTVSGMACITDISRLKWAEAWQTRLAEDAQSAKRQQEAFIDVVSHEMRNPLSAIVHCADAISLSIDDIKAKTDSRGIPDSVLDALKANASAASIILDCCKHQKRIIDDILTLSRLESTFLSLKPTAVRPSALVNSVLSMFEAELRSKIISTTVVAEPSIEELNIDHVQLDASRVTQIFINLLTNAIKFMKEGGEREIEIRYGASLSPPRSTNNVVSCPEGVRWAPLGENTSDVTEDPEWGSGPVVYLTFSLADTGIGMRMDEVEKIFERFRQASIMTHVTYGGSGLGLFISKELTERMAGEIGVMSTPGTGSLFVFYVKTRRAEKEQSSIVLPLRPLPTRALSAVKAHKPHVLLVEDNIINQKVLRRHLARSGCEIEVANHGVEALEILCKPEARFDVILMDMQMPVMDGLACTREVRDLEKAGALPGRLPIIAVTANVRKEQIEKALAAGADRVFQKPFKASDLVSLMRELIDGIPDDGRQPQGTLSAPAQVDL